MPEKHHTGLEERTAKVEGILEQMDKRLDRVEIAIADLKNEVKSDIEKLEVGLRADMGKLETSVRNDISKVDNRIEKLETKTDSQFKWLVGIIVATWITAILTIIFKG